MGFGRCLGRGFSSYDFWVRGELNGALQAKARPSISDPKTCKLPENIIIHKSVDGKQMLSLAAFETFNMGSSW